MVLCLIRWLGYRSYCFSEFALDLTPCSNVQGIRVSTVGVRLAICKVVGAGMTSAHMLVIFDMLCLNTKYLMGSPGLSDSDEGCTCPRNRVHHTLRQDSIQIGLHCEV